MGVFLEEELDGWDDVCFGGVSSSSDEEEHESMPAPNKFDSGAAFDALLSPLAFTLFVIAAEEDDSSESDPYPAKQSIGATRKSPERFRGPITLVFLRKTRSLHSEEDRL